jgi:endonuclease YncB( thermonuclease family)
MLRIAQDSGSVKLFRSLLFALAAILGGAAGAGERCTAMDGATLQCGRERVRVEGLNAPQLKAPGGQQARQRLQQRLQAGEIVIERRGRDKHGRTLGRLYVSGKRITQSDLAPDARQKR